VAALAGWGGQHGRWHRRRNVGFVADILGDIVAALFGHAFRQLHPRIAKGLGCLFLLLLLAGAIWLIVVLT